MHLIVEVISLIFFIPEFQCLFQSDLTCDGRPKFSFLNATLLAVTSDSRRRALAGRAFFACIRLRVFGLVRHWKNSWINKNFLKRRGQQGWDNTLEHKIDATGISGGSTAASGGTGGNIDKADRNMLPDAAAIAAQAKLMQKQRDAALINGSNIGTALMVTNSYRVLTIFCAITGLFPMITLIYYRGVSNSVVIDMVDQLQGTNIRFHRDNKLRAWSRDFRLSAGVGTFSVNMIFGMDAGHTDCCRGLFQLIQVYFIIQEG